MPSSPVVTMMFCLAALLAVAITCAADAGLPPARTLPVTLPTPASSRSIVTLSLPGGTALASERPCASCSAAMRSSFSPMPRSE